MLTILIVDDNPSFRAQAARLCQSEGFSTVTAGDLSELSHVLTTSKPDLVLVDIELPTIPGHRLGALIRSRHQVPIVLISALSEDRLRRLYESSDADGWICKPLTRDKLIAAVTRFVTKQKPEATASTRTAEGAGDASAFRVLLVEDEPIIASRIESSLTGLASITSVGDGDAALECLVRSRFDCILLDLTLPHLSGFDVLRHLMLHAPASLKNTIVMTAASDESLQFIDPAAVAGLLRKPFQMGTLVEMVDAIARRSR
ncbi:MAG TPA: response regulator [Thermoanaerobaculia bacterium]|nr:response regulator [Thermoanaerobaculia bacterium]